MFPGGFDISRLEDLLYPELWFIDNMTKKNRDLVNNVVADYNGLSYNSITEFFMKDSKIVLGEPISGQEDSNNLNR